MTERSRASMTRDASRFAVGPSQLHWNGECLTIAIDEVTVPIPKRVRGQVRVYPKGLCGFVASLDDGGLHRWGADRAVLAGRGRIRCAGHEVVRPRLPRLERRR